MGVLSRIVMLVITIFTLSDVFGASTAEQVFSKASPSIVVIVALDSAEKPIGTGSGVVVGKNKVVTNWHVVSDASSVIIRRKDTNYPAELIADRRDRDLALLSAKGLDAPPVSTATINSVSVGQGVFAIGAPSGLELTITNGIVSALRDVDNGKLIQTSAAISPGSSGGGLFNDDGRLVGITTLKLAGGAREGLGFAVSADWVNELHSPDGKQNNDSSSWVWIAAIFFGFVFIFFGKRIYFGLIDKVSFASKNSVAARESSIELDSKPKEHENYSKAKRNIPFKYVSIAQHEIDSGAVDQTIYKQAVTFSNNDPAKLEEIYLALRADNLFEADRSVGVKEIDISVRSVEAGQTDESQRSNGFGLKIWLVGVGFVFVVLLACVPWFLGKVFEDNLRANVSFQTKAQKNFPITTKIVSYERDWISSKIILEHDFGEGGFSIKSKSTLSHFPIWHHGVGIKLMSALSLPEGSAYFDTRQSVTTFFYLMGGFDGVSEFSDIVAKPVPGEAGSFVSIRGLVFKLGRESSSAPIAISSNLAGLALEDKKKKIGLSDVSLSIDNIGVLYGSFAKDAKATLVIGNMLADDSSDNTHFKLSNFRISAAQKISGNLFDFDNSFSIKEVVFKASGGTDLKINDIETGLEFKNLNTVALADFDSIFGKKKASGVGANAFQLLPVLFSNSPSAIFKETKFSILSDEISGTFIAKAEASVNSEGLVPETSMVGDYVDRIKAAGLVSVSQKLFRKFLENNERTSRKAYVDLLRSQGKIYSAEQTDTYLQGAKLVAETQIKELLDNKVITPDGDFYKIKISFVNGDLVVNDLPNDGYVKTLTQEFKSGFLEGASGGKSGSVSASDQSSKLKSLGYRDQVQLISKWAASGNVSVSNFSPMQFGDLAVAKAFLQRKGIVELPIAVVDSLRDKEVWWIDSGGFHIYLPNLSVRDLNGFAYELDLGGNCNTRVGPFSYFLIAVNPALSPTKSRVVTMPKPGDLPTGKEICGTLVSAW